jgi:DNA-binding MarR family transcriptional regulator
MRADVDAETAGLLRRIFARIARQLNASATGEGLTPSQASVLGLLGGHGPLSLGELAEMEGLNPTMLSRVVGKLDSADLIRRIPDPADLRSATVEITPAGRRVDKRIKRHRAAVLSECVARLPADQADMLLASLPALEGFADELKRANLEAAAAQPRIFRSGP